MKQESKQEFIDLINQQPEEEWKSHADLFLKSPQTHCTIVWAGARLLPPGEYSYARIFREKFEFSDKEYHEMFALNDLSKTAEEAHRRIASYVESL